MGRYAKSGYDMDPVYENDSVVIRGIVEEMVEDAIRAALKPTVKEERKPKSKQAPKAKIGPRLMLSQEHMTKRGQVICSHLLAMPKGESPEDNPDIKHVFNQHPFDDEKVRDGWNIIHDRSLNAQYPDHDIYWLCSADWLSEIVVKAVIEAAIKVEKAAPVAITPVRKVTNEIVLG